MFLLSKDKKILISYLGAGDTAVIPLTVESIAKDAFSNSKLQSVVFLDNGRNLHIDSNAFSSSCIRASIKFIIKKGGRDVKQLRRELERLNLPDNVTADISEEENSATLLQPKIIFEEKSKYDWIYIDSETNTVVLLIPMTGGNTIGTDNTCKSAVAQEEFWFGDKDGKRSSARESLLLMKDHIDCDLNRLSSVLTEKEVKGRCYKLEQIERYLEMLRCYEVIEQQKDESYLDKLRTRNYPDYSDQILSFLKIRDTNVLSMLLSPKTKDEWLRSVNPVCSFDRTKKDFLKECEDAFSQLKNEGRIVHESKAAHGKDYIISKAVSHVTEVLAKKKELYMSLDGSQEDQFVSSVYGEEQSKQIGDFVISMRDVLGDFFKGVFEGSSPDFSKSAYEDREINVEYLGQVNPLFNECTLRDILDADEVLAEIVATVINIVILDCTWDTLKVSPFIAYKDKQDPKGDFGYACSFLLQFFVAHVNLYARSIGKCKVDMGQALETKEQQSDLDLIFKLNEQYFDDRDVYESLFNAEIFTDQAFLIEPLDAEDKAAIIKLFERHVSTVLNMQHKDEFSVLFEGKRPFASYQHHMCIPFATYFNHAINEMLSKKSYEHRMANISLRYIECYGGTFYLPAAVRSEDSVVQNIKNVESKGAEIDIKKVKNLIVSLASGSNVQANGKTLDELGELLRECPWVIEKLAGFKPKDFSSLEIYNGHLKNLIYILSSNKSLIRYVREMHIVLELFKEREVDFQVCSPFLINRGLYEKIVNEKVFDDSIGSEARRKFHEVLFKSGLPIIDKKTFMKHQSYIVELLGVPQVFKLLSKNLIQDHEVVFSTLLCNKEMSRCDLDYLNKHRPSVLRHLDANKNVILTLLQTSPCWYPKLCISTCNEMDVCKAMLQGMQCCGENSCKEEFAKNLSELIEFIEDPESLNSDIKSTILKWILESEYPDQAARSNYLCDLGIDKKILASQFIKICKEEDFTLSKCFKDIIDMLGVIDVFEKLRENSNMKSRGENISDTVALAVLCCCDEISSDEVKYLYQQYPIIKDLINSSNGFTGRAVAPLFKLMQTSIEWYFILDPDCQCAPDVFSNFHAAFSRLFAEFASKRHRPVVPDYIFHTPELGIRDKLFSALQRLTTMVNNESFTNSEIRSSVAILVVRFGCDDLFQHFIRPLKFAAIGAFLRDLPYESAKSCAASGIIKKHYLDYLVHIKSSKVHLEHSLSDKFIDAFEISSVDLINTIPKLDESILLDLIHEKTFNYNLHFIQAFCPENDTLNKKLLLSQPVELLWDMALSDNQCLNFFEKLGVVDAIIKLLVSNGGGANHRIYSLMDFYRRQIGDGYLQAVLPHLSEVKKHNSYTACYLMSRFRNPLVLGYFSKNIQHILGRTFFITLSQYLDSHYKPVQLIRMIETVLQSKTLNEIAYLDDSANTAKRLQELMILAHQFDMYNVVKSVFDYAYYSRNVTQAIVSVMICSVIIDYQTSRKVAPTSTHLLVEKLLDLGLRGGFLCFDDMLLTDYNSLLAGSSVRSLLYAGAKPVSTTDELLSLFYSGRNHSIPKLFLDHFTHAYLKVISQRGNYYNWMTCLAQDDHNSTKHLPVEDTNRIWATNKSSERQQHLLTARVQTPLNALARVELKVNSFNNSNHHPFLVAISKNKIITIYSQDQNKKWVVSLRLTVDLPDVVESTCSPIGQTFVLHSSGNNIQVCMQKENSEWETCILDCKSLVRVITFSPDGSCFVTGLDDGTCRVWSQVGDNHWISALLSGHKRSVRAISFSPDGSFFVTGSDDGTCCVWTKSDSGHWQPYAPLINHNGWVRAISHSSDGSHFITGSNDGYLCVWRREENGLWCGKRLPCVGAGVDTISYAPNGKYFVVTMYNRYIRIYSNDNQFHLQSSPCYKEHVTRIHTIRHSGDGSHFVTISDDSCCRIWTPKHNGHWESAAPMYFDSVCNIRFAIFNTHTIVGCTPDAQYFLVKDFQGKVEVWGRNENDMWEACDSLCDSIEDINLVSFGCWPAGMSLQRQMERARPSQLLSQTLFNSSQVLNEHAATITVISQSPDGSYFETDSGDNTISRRRAPDLMQEPVDSRQSSCQIL